LLIVAIITTLLLSGFFSGAEIAFISSSRLNIELRRRDGSRAGRLLATMYDHPSQFISVMLVGNNIVLVAFAYLMSLVLDPILAPGIEHPILMGLAQTIIITTLVLLFGEFIPKTIFRIFSYDLLSAFVYPLSFFTYALAIPARIMRALSQALLRLVFRGEQKVVSTNFSRYDLEEFVQDRAADAEEEMETEMFRNALHLKKTRVRSVMVPRTEIKHIDQTASLKELSALFQETKHSRILITDGDIDNILGYVHHQQLIGARSRMRDMIMSINLVPEAMSVQDLLLKFMREKNSIAYVVDEFGGTSGLITLEDILEEIFGEIEDEHDEDGHIGHQIDEQTYRLSGRLEIQYINELFPLLELPEGEYTTLSGYIVMTSGHIPDEGEKVEIDRHKFTIERVSDTKIELVLVELMDATHADHSS
jgi:CBS domain containing-hemolysin-like protein